MEGGGIQKAPKTQNMTGYQKFRSRHPLGQGPPLCAGPGSPLAFLVEPLLDINDNFK